MKYFFAIFLTFSLFTTPVLVLADTASSSTTTASTTISALADQIAALRAELKSLLEQLQQLLKQRVQSLQNGTASNPNNGTGANQGGFIFPGSNPLGGGSPSGSSALGQTPNLGSIIQSVLSTLNPSWTGSGDDSGTDYQVPGVKDTGGGTYDFGAKNPYIFGASSEESQRVYDEAYKAAMGTSPIETSQYGRLGCAYAVAEVLKRAGLSVGEPSTLTSTVALKAAIEKAGAKFTYLGSGPAALARAVPGDIVISPTAGGKTGHTGICMDEKCSRIASNSSSKQRFVVNYTAINWVNRFQNNIYVYHPGKTGENTRPYDPAATPDSNLGGQSQSPVAKSPVIVYSTAGCHFCTEAKNFLTSQQIPFEYRSVMDDNYNYTTWYSQARSAGVTSYPTILYGDERVVGFDSSIGNAIVQWYRSN